MATILEFNAALLPRGPFDLSASYETLNFVESGGSGYVCLQPCSGIPVTNTAYWFKFVHKGDPGTPFTYADLTAEQKAELAHDATIAAQAAQAAAEQAAQKFATIKASIDAIDPQSTEGSIQTLAAKQGVLEAELDQLGPKIGEVDVRVKTVNYADITMPKGAVVGSTGANASSDNFYRTPFIDIDGYDKVKFLGFISTSASLTFGYAFYSSNDVASYISGDRCDIDTSLSEYEQKEFIVNIPTGAKYFRSCIYKTFRSSYYLIARTGEAISDRLNSLDSAVEELSERKTVDAAEANLRYVTCNSALSSEVRLVNIEGFDTLTGGSIKVLMTNRIVTAAECTFKVNNSTYEAPLYYEGARAGASNTWANGELVEVFFDGTNWQAFRLKNVVVDATPTENSSNALRSGAAYTKFQEIDGHVRKLNDEVFDTIADITPYKISANRTVNSLGKKSTINGFAYIGYGANGYNGFPVGVGSTITANEGYRFNYVVRPEDSDGNNQTNLELQQGVTGSVTISHAGYLFISVEPTDNDRETAITADEARALAAAGISVSLLLNLSKIDELENRVSELENSSTIGAEVHTDIKNMPWVFGNISTGGTYTYDRDSVVLDRYIGVKKGSTITCLSNVQMQVRMIIDGSASYRSYATGTWTAETDCRIRFGFKYANSAEFKNMAILDDTSCTLYLQQGINRYDRRKVVNLYGVPNAVYRGCHVDDTGLTEATVDYDAFIAPWDALVTSSNGYLTRKDLGETYNGKHLYCYRLGISYDRPNSYKPIIFIVTNVHGHEKTSTLGAFYLMKDLIEHYAENPVLQWIRDNAIIKVIPACNIYGIINNTRYNQNRVNINRNYAAFSWEDFDDTAGGMNNSKGEAPESEVETSIIVEELLSESSTTALAIDIHTNGRPIDTPNYGALLYTNWRGEYFGDYDYQMRNVSAAFHANMRGIFDDYGVGGSATDIYGSLREQKTDPTFERWLAESTNIWGGTLEVPCGYATGIGTRLTPYSADTIKVSGEIIGNYIIQMLYGLSHGSV